MSKLKKLIKDPRLFLLDAYYNRVNQNIGKSNKVVFVIGFSTWKTYLRKYFSEYKLDFIPKNISKEDFNKQYRKKILKYKSNCQVFVWGFKFPQYIQEFLLDNKIKIVYVEDGFIRSIQLGATKAPPMSLTLDSKTTYFDATKESELENLLNNYNFSENLKIIEDSKKLEKETQKVKILNATLEQRVQDEVEKNRKKDQQMVQQSRLAQMGEMISMIAHQWRQPLAAISSVSSSLEIKAQLKNIDNETVIERSRKISQYSQHLSSTIDDFRDFFKSEKQHAQTSFSELLDSVLNIVQTPIENKNITIIQDLQDCETFSSYPNELKQVILNLIKNAEEALIENKTEKPYIKIKSYQENNQHILQVSDNAGGIPQEILEKVFDPYFSTKMEKNGSGLGLYMSKTIIEEHCNGQINVQNISEGALFTLSIPV